MPSKSKASKRKASAPINENDNKAARTNNSSDAPTSRNQGLCSLATLSYSIFHVFSLLPQQVLKKLGEQLGPIAVKVVTLTS